jgi:hypothetical protein
VLSRLEDLDLTHTGLRDKDVRRLTNAMLTCSVHPPPAVVPASWGHPEDEQQCHDSPPTTAGQVTSSPISFHA